MRYRMTSAALLGALLLALPASAAAQRNEGTRMSAHMLEGDPITRLLEARERLALSPEQVSALQEIAARVRTDTEAEMAQLRAVREKHRAAMEEARALLTEEQRTTAREMMRAERPERRRPPGRKGRAGA